MADYHRIVDAPPAERLLAGHLTPADAHLQRVPDNCPYLSCFRANLLQSAIAFIMHYKGFPFINS